MAHGTDTILVLDTDASALARSADVLGGLGHKVVVAQTPRAALEILRGRSSIGAVLVDIMLGGIDDVVGQVRRKRPNVQIIYTTSYSEMMLLDREVPERMPLLRKPLDPARVKTALAGVAQ